MNDKERIVKLVQRRADVLLKCLHECKETMPMGKYLRKQAMYSTCLWLLEKINAMPNIDQKPTEDERIRKGLIKGLSAMRDIHHHQTFSDDAININEALAWLEMQGANVDINPSEFEMRLNKLLKQFESLPKEDIVSSLSFYLNVIQNDGTYKAEEKQGEQKPAYSDEDEKMYRMCIDAVEYYHTPEDESAIREWLKSLKNRVQPQPKKWSEEDEKMRKALIRFFQWFPYDRLNYENLKPIEAIAWLEKQGKQKPTSNVRYEVGADGSLSVSVVNGKPFDYEKATITQKDFAPKQEWSEEDEEMTEDLIKGCISAEKEHHLVHTSKEIADWLISLKNRMQGKEE